ncbi:MAG: ribonuclease HII [Candidatus Omnitrophica bacterium]|nr:ribonuclease HII [Candidatus Omnitrophota bacterium]
MIVGVDEAGRGPLAGVVTACALYLKKEPPENARDSKELTPFARQEIFGWLTGNASFAVGVASPAEIDEINILEATMLAANRAIIKLLKKEPRLKKASFIIDGNIFRTKLDIKYKCIEKADKTVKQVSCASIVAKVTRDYLMMNAHFLYPEWNFKVHKGYPTKEHFELITKQALSPLHRKTFYPCTDAKR